MRRRLTLETLEPRHLLDASLLQPEILGPLHGFYDAPVEVDLVDVNHGVDGAEIRYTTDGSPPSAGNGWVYSETITIDSTTVLRAAAVAPGRDPSPVRTQSYFFLDDVLGQSPANQTPPGWPDAAGFLGQQMVYRMDPRIVDDPVWGPQLRDALLALPTWSIVIDMADFSGPSGIYSNPQQRGRDWERPASFELIDPSGEQPGFTHDGGIRILGNFSRSPMNPKHNFRVYFRSEYDVGMLPYPLYGDGVDRFDKIDLRTAQNFSWQFPGTRFNTLLRDVWSRDAQHDMGQPSTRSLYVHLYINGVYWGIYQAQERPDRRHAESHFGGDREDYDVVKHGSGTGKLEVTDGSADALLALWHAANQIADEPDPESRYALYMQLQGLNPDGARNETYDVLLDRDNLIDYMLLIIHSGDRDAPISGYMNNVGINNWYAVRDRTGEQGWRFFVHDSEHTLGLPEGVEANRVGPFGQRNADQANPQWIFQQLWNVEEFRVAVGDRAHRHLFHDGALTAENNIQRLLARKEQIELAIIAESARWGGTHMDPPATKNTWQTAVDFIVEQFFPQRNAIVVDQLRSVGLYPDAAAPSLAQHGGIVAPGWKFSFDAAAGTVYFTTDGTDPRLVGGGISPSAQMYDPVEPPALLESSNVQARVLDDGQWSALLVATFEVDESLSPDPEPPPRRLLIGWDVQPSSRVVLESRPWVAPNRAARDQAVEELSRQQLRALALSNLRARRESLVGV